MSQATYRGCQYNTDTPKQEYQHWYSETHAPAAPLKAGLTQQIRAEQPKLGPRQHQGLQSVRPWRKSVTEHIEPDRE